MPPRPFGRAPAASLEKSVCISPLPPWGGHGCCGLGCGLLLRAAVPLADHWFSSPLGDGRGAPPLSCELDVRAVEVDELEEADDWIEDDELVRESGFRCGTNMPLTSLGFIGALPSMEPHDGRDIAGKVGGLATAVMG